MPDNCDEVSRRAQQVLETGETLQAHPREARLVLGGRHAFRPDALPVGVWLQREIEPALRDAGLWCDGLTLAVDHYFGPDYDDSGNEVWPGTTDFVVWAADSALYAGTANVRIELDGPPPPNYDNEDAYLRASSLSLNLHALGGRAALPPDTDLFLDEEKVDSGWHPGCILVVALLVIGVLMAIVGVVTTVQWIWTALT